MTEVLEAREDPADLQQNRHSAVNYCGIRCQQEYWQLGTSQQECAGTQGECYPIKQDILTKEGNFVTTGNTPFYFPLW